MQPLTTAAKRRPHCEVAMFRLLMWPSNTVCDAMGLADEGERGVVRMLVNMMLLALISVLVFVVFQRTL